MRKIRILLVSSNILLILLFSCEARGDADNLSEVNNMADEPAAMDENPPLDSLTMQEIIESKDDYFTIVNLSPSDGDYYFGDLTKSPSKGWYGSYGGEYVVVELDEKQYFDDTVQFILETYARRTLEDGTVQQTDSDFYVVEISREQFIEAMKDYESGITDAVVLEAEAVPLE